MKRTAYRSVVRQRLLDLLGDCRIVVSYDPAERNRHLLIYVPWARAKSSSPTG
jgi:hypothetical protein